MGGIDKYQIHSHYHSLEARPKTQEKDRHFRHLYLLLRDTSNSQCITPLRSINDNAQQAPTGNPSHGQRNDPPTINPSHHAPVNSLRIARAKPNTHRSSNNALRSRDRKSQARSHHDRDRRAEFHREAARRRVQRQPVPQIAHDVVSEGPQTDDERGGAIAQDPDRDGGLGGELAGVPDQVDGGEGTDGAGFVNEGSRGMRIGIWTY